MSVNSYSTGMLSAVLFLIITLLIIPVSAATGTIIIPELKVSYGSEFIVPVTIEDSLNLGAVLFDVRYGTLTLDYIGTEPGTLKPDAIIEAREIKPGVVEVGVIDSKGLTGTGTIALLKFRVSDDSDGSSSLIPAVIDAYDTSGKPVQIDTKGGKVTISGSATSASQESRPATGTTTRTPLEPLAAITAVVFAVAGCRWMRKR